MARKQQNDQDSPHIAIKRARQVEAFVDQLEPGPRMSVEGASDERTSAHLHQRNLGAAGQITFGKIVYSVPYAHYYRVQLDNGAADIGCSRLGSVAAQPFSVRDVSPLPPNTPVLVWVHPEGVYGVILGALPDIMVDGGISFSDWISQGSNGGFKRERYYLEALNILADHGGIVDFSNHRPQDSLGLGEWGRFGDLGTGVFVDMFMSFIRADETCGLWCFYMDRLARLCGYNLDIRTAGSELNVRNDEGEIVHFHGYTGYPWEAAGLFSPGGSPFRDIGAEGVQYDEPHAAKEPQNPDQMSFFRFEEFHGYLGQGYMRHVVVPPKESGSFNQYTNFAPRIGVFREQIGYDGAYSLQSAHSLHFLKRSIIPIPKRVKPMEDATGDSIKEGGGYAFAGLGSPQHKIADIIVNTELPNLRTAAGLMDYHAHLCNWKSLHPFHYHVRDFHTPNQEDVQPFEKLSYVPEFGELGQSMWLPRPDPKKVRVDHRHGEVDYYETTAGLSVLPDGSVVIRDGYGGEILMSGGSIRLSAPGDIWRQPGRSCIDWSGDDHVIRANNSVDVTSSKKDIRLKAEYNMEFLSGNNGKFGRMLFESRSESRGEAFHDYENKIGEEIRGSGIVFKAKDSQMVVWADGLYLRSLDSDIVLDAGQGARDIRTVSRLFNRHISLAAQDAFPHNAEKTTVNTYTASNAQIMTPLQLAGFLVVISGGVIVNGSISLAGGHIATELANDYDGLTGVLEGQSLKDIYKTMEETVQSFTSQKQSMQSDYSAAIYERFYEDKSKVGNEELITNVEFSLRNEQQYGTINLQLPEAYWQQLSRISGKIPATWEEEKVTYQGDELMPHPGRIKWEEEPTLYTSDLKLHQLDTNRDAQRGSDYEEVTLDDWNPMVFKDNYPVVVINSEGSES